MVSVSRRATDGKSPFDDEVGETHFSNFERVRLPEHRGLWALVHTKNTVHIIYVTL